MADTADTPTQPARARAGDKLRVLLADDHELFTETLSLYLDSQPDIDLTCVPTFDAAQEAMETTGHFDVVLLDYGMPGMRGLEGIERAMEKNGKYVALLSGNVAWPTIEKAIEIGAAGFVPKTISARSFVNAIRFMASGETYLPSGMIRDLHGDTVAQEYQLKPNERSVLTYLGEGLQNKEIARLVGLSEMTVKMYVKSICSKLGAKNRTQAVIIAKREGLC